MSEEKTITIKQDKYFKKDEEQNSYIELLKKLPHRHPFFITYIEIVDYIDKLQQENSQLKQKLSILSVKPAIPTTEEKLKYRIEKAIEYIENNSLYEEEYDYDYEENSYLSGIDDKQAKEELLEILKGDKE